MIRGLRPASMGFLAAAALLAAPAAAAPRAISVQDSFRIGSAGVLCTAQVRPLDPALKGMFDRGYGVTCRDAAAAVGNLYALRAAAADPLADLLAARADKLDCAAPAPETVPGVGAATMTECTAESGLKRRAYAFARGRTTYLAEGLGGYDSALRLGLATLVADRPVDGVVEVATTAAGDPAAFARVQAGALDPDAALTQAYQRNNAGSYAESAEFFETLFERDLQRPGGGRAGEYLVNQGLQQSNLGNFATADLLFAQAEQRGATVDPLVSRLLRNARAVHYLNQRRAAAARRALDAKVAAVPRGMTDAELAQGVISASLADQINRENAALERLGAIDGRLQPYERAQILDGQARQLRGVALRLQGKYADATRSLTEATRLFEGVREGRVASTAFMRSETQAEMALIAEAQTDYPAAERDFAEAQRILDLDYPGSAAGLAAKARRAAFLARRGDAARALPLYAEVVAAAERQPGAAATMRPLLAPYFALLAPRAGSDPASAQAMFAASQIMTRPGVAQTQAVFARELSSGDGAAATLFRQSVTLAREVSRSAGEVARLAAAAAPQGSPEAATLAAARARLAGLERDQTELQSRLADYPRYRVLAAPAVTLDDLRKALRPHEAYYQLRLIGEDVYAMLVTPEATRAIKVATTATKLGDDVAKLRASIVTVENGRTATYPFDVALARRLYLDLFEPLGDPLDGVANLIFEPDGPMLQLPPNLLVMEQAGVDAYAARLKQPNSDEYDFRGVAWIGRDRDVTTAVSPRAFVDVRTIAPSKGKFAYLGLGHNARPSPQTMFRRASMTSAPDDCEWPLAVWENPIQPTELVLANRIVGGEVVTDGAFTDTALKARADLADYRILHFATHGLVTAPKPECPARPALVTSFGDAGSDGLLSFREIYDLRLDADVVVLSACDTAGAATVEATREAGVTTGGNFALDGLVRAFVGAGARSVIASHWPIPDDYQATERLMRALFSAPAGTPIAEALRTGQRELMNAAETSHPYYWSAFAIVGDGERPMLRKE